jgi:hypothetical protein
MADEKRRLIDANELMSEVHWYDEQQKADVWLTSDIEALLAEQPTVDAVEVVHGRWLYYSTTMQECSNCHGHTARHKFKYCPHCGAVMEDKYNESAD